MTRVEYLKIRDKLVIILQSDMGRTPHYKKRAASKDHRSIGSVVFMGLGIKGNRVIGATDEKHFIIPINSQSLTTNNGQGKRNSRPARTHSLRASSFRWMFQMKNNCKYSGAECLAQWIECR